MADSLNAWLAKAKAMQAELSQRRVPPDEGATAATEQVLASSVVKGTRGYIERVTNQVNGTYEHGWFDACAVMIRRLLEMVIIEAFEHNGLAAKIKNSTDDFVHLGDLIDKALAEPAWNLGRNTRAALPRLKGLGDRSAHSRRFNAHRRDVDRHIDAVRDVVQEFIYLAHLK